MGIEVEFGSSSQNRVGVELRLGLQVLLRVGYDPETMSESCFLEKGSDEIRIDEGAASIGAGDANGVISDIMQSAKEW